MEPFSERFETLDGAEWHRADYAFSHPMFDTDWDKDQVALDGGMVLSLNPQSGANRFKGASIRRQDPTHFGRYEARLQAGRGAGVITGFFLYTGPAYGTQHDEIDWEIFGKDPTTAQVAWFKDGVLHEHKVELGFDASDCVHEYAIEWTPESIRWFLNGELVFETREAIPQTPQSVFTNIWAADPSIAGWAGLADPATETKARALSIDFRPMPFDPGS